MKKAVFLFSWEYGFCRLIAKPLGGKKALFLQNIQPL